MNLSEVDTKDLFNEAFERIVSQSDGREGRLVDEFFELFDGWGCAERLYSPDAVLVARIADYNRWCETKEGEEPGHLMEEIAYLAFRCLEGLESIKCFQSYAAQHDLVVSGSKSKWFLLMQFLHLPREGRTIVVEAKNLADPVSDSQFSRLCGILQNKFDKMCHLGVFFTRSGVSGFPRLSQPDSPEPRQRSLRDARATQVIFHARTGKFVVALGHEDLQRLLENGALPRILEAKIRDIEDAGGLSLQFDEDWREIDLPSHFSQYLPQSTKGEVAS